VEIGLNPSTYSWIQTRVGISFIDPSILQRFPTFLVVRTINNVKKKNFEAHLSIKHTHTHTKDDIRNIDVCKII